MWFSSLVSFSFSRLVFHLLFHLLSCLVSSPSLRLVLSSSLPSALLSVSVFFLFSLPLSSLSLSSFSVFVCCCVLCCGVVWCGVVWCDTIKTSPCVHSKTSPCVPAPLAHVETHVRVVPAYTETFWTGHTECMGEGRGLSSASCFSSKKLVICEHVEQHLNPMSGSCLVANLLLTKIGQRSYHLLERLTKVTTGSFPFSSLRIGREQHVLDSSNHSPHHFNIQSTASPSLSAVSTLSLLVKTKREAL